MSRILGASETALSDFITASYNANYGDVSALGYQAYGKNLAYLLYKGVYNLSELKNFVGNGMGSQPLKRYEAAMMLTKLVGKEAEAKNNAMPILSYDDSSDIPAIAKAYVEFCETSGLMQGMEDNRFNPDFEVTRAQIAVMLYRAMEYMGTEHSTGIISSIDYNTNIITYIDKYGVSKQVSAMSGARLSLDGRTIGDISGVKNNYKINVVTNKSNVVFVEFLTYVPTPEVTTVEGVIKEIVISENPSIRVETASGMINCALNTKDVAITLNGAVCDIYGLRLGYTATVEMENSTVKTVAVRTN